MARGIRTATRTHRRRVLGGAEGAPRARPGAVRAATLLELVAVLVILAVLAAVAMPRFSNSALVSAQGEACAANVANALRLARRMAVEHGATNASGYSVVCTAGSYRLLDLGTNTYGPATPLADGWQFERSDYTVTFDPYGGARSLNGGGTSLAVSKRSGRWLISFEPATGYVWYAGG